VLLLLGNFPRWVSRPSHISLSFSFISHEGTMRGRLPGRGPPPRRTKRVRASGVTLFTFKAINSSRVHDLGKMPFWCFMGISSPHQTHRRSHSILPPSPGKLSVYQVPSSQPRRQLLQSRLISQPGQVSIANDVLPPLAKFLCVH